VWRILQPQKIALGISHYVINTIGEFYVEAINVFIKDIYKDSDSRTPIIFVLSPGADPTANLLKFAN
jgi:dynein heavy chain